MPACYFNLNPHPVPNFGWQVNPLQRGGNLNPTLTLPEGEGNSSFKMSEIAPSLLGRTGVG